jgi:hypothetical protein
VIEAGFGLNNSYKKESVMQKLITITLASTSIGDHGKVEEHLEKYLKAGWRVDNIIQAGTGVANLTCSGSECRLSSDLQGIFAGWIVIVLEKGRLE